MKRFHVHVAVENLDDSVRFYSTLFGAEPSVVRSDYAKWMLEDPRLNFALSKRTLVGRPGINHLGIQVDTDEELQQIHARLAQANTRVESEQNVECCYAESDKYWAKDPQGLAWEAFHSLGTVQHYYGDAADAAATGVSLLNKPAKECSVTKSLATKAGQLIGCCR
jgi:catechol 2,3-dioxygenase-like lactoylglutathione lyase family enzyme